MRFLGIGFVLFVILEIFSIIWAIQLLGGGVTILLMLISFILGTMMLQKRGISSVLLVSSIFKTNGKISFYQMLWPIRYTLAAVLLIIPGFFSTVLSLLLLIPIKGKVISKDHAKNIFNEEIFNAKSKHKSNTNDDIIEGEFEVKDNKKDTNS